MTNIDNSEKLGDKKENIDEIYLKKLGIVKRKVSAIKDVKEEEEFLMIKFSYDDDENQCDSNII
ncbi:hypothetical protein [[Clostridium] innocuum]|uniref:hypothetical protein n=1 Tax=Clostridium innocuum TaxID=1522 RepID=UPI000D6A7E0B|nr:hypothetical protein [[Clostridium] innocuum]MCR0316620.1 hypothetical protein [[Clostridium] innocuum]MCR0371909.1 hypothetical protein [[Clostridium] innocuum]MCR0561270.1 hypothetical protein [[Clostridium] innocuum]MCR0604580.1 hypothetical protein [[Clostridium] innocuum]PWJ10156.1 hypothetical protein ATF84_12318 [[Clostridium] innocuum]